jgi:hypothetical protein
MVRQKYAFLLGTCLVGAIASLLPGAAQAKPFQPVNGFPDGTDGGQVTSSAHGLQVAPDRPVGPGATLTAKFGGPIFGWSINENGTDGVLTQVSSLNDPYTSYVETFDQTTAKVVKVVRKENSGTDGNHELAVDAILANDVALIDDERDDLKTLLRHDVYYTMAPVTGNKITGTWTRPPGKDFLIYDIADQQTDPDTVIAATKLDGTITRPPTFEVVVTNVASNKIGHVLYAPRLDGVNYPYFVAEDTTTHHAYVPAANYHSKTVFIDFNVRTGAVSNRFTAPAFSGPVQGIAIDPATHMMCTTTGATYSVQMYDLTTRKQTFVGQIPNAGGEGQAGTLIAADPINHLFLVEQPNSLRGGSEIYVYDEKGNVLESLTGFAFGTPGGIQVVAKTRSGYVPGPNANQLTSFTY